MDTGTDRPVEKKQPARSWFTAVKAKWSTLQTHQKIIVGVVAVIAIFALFNATGSRSYTKAELERQWINVPMHEIESHFGRNGEFGIGSYGEIHWITYPNSVVDGRTDDGNRGDVRFSAVGGRCFDVRILKMRSQFTP